MNKDKSLIVPMQVHALCVGADEGGQKGSFFSPPTATFLSTLPSKDREAPFVSGPSINIPFQTAESIDKGVHLHWFLPDALTHASDEQRPEDGKSAFPVVPNRWLVTRIHTTNEPEAEPHCESRSWIVESDFLSTDSKYRRSTSVPWADSDIPYRYMGRALPLEEWSGDDGEPHEGERFKPLTSIGYGEPSFAIYYPNCRNVFGFHDALDDLDMWDLSMMPDSDETEKQRLIENFKAESNKDTRVALILGVATNTTKVWTIAILNDKGRFISKELIGNKSDKLCIELEKEKSNRDKNRIIELATSYLGISLLDDYSSKESNLSYTVIGWYGNPDEDPIFAARYAKEIKKCLSRFKWVVQKELDVSHLSNTVYCGMIQNVQWCPKDDFITRDLIVDFGMGNRVLDGLSALLSGMTSDSEQERQRKERLLDALQVGQLDQLGKVDAMAELTRTLHKNSFVSEDGGILWSINGKDPEKKENLGTLSHDVALQLDELNSKQAQFNRKFFESESKKQQAFLDWYKYMLFLYDSDTKKDLREKKVNANKFKKFLEPGEEDNELIKLQNEIETLLEDLAKKIGDDYVLKNRAASRFFRPSDPVILMAGEGLKPTLDYFPDVNLPCVLESQLLLPKILEDKIKISTDDLPLPENSSLPKCTRSLLTELLFLDPANFPVMAASASDKANSVGIDEITKIIEGKSVFLSKGNFDIAPSTIAITEWIRPWNPLFMHWSVEYKPLEKIGDNSELKSFPPTLITSRFALSEHTIDLNGQGSSEQKYETYTGSTMLTPHAVRNFEELAASFLEKSWKNPDILKALKAVKETPVLSQAMGGFHDALIMKNEEMQFPVDDPVDISISGKAFQKKIKEYVGERNQYAPMPHNYFNPVRAGKMKIANIRVVDTFGQYRERSPRKVYTAQNLTLSGDDEAHIFLPPRLVQSSRTLLRWISTERELMETNDHPATTPVCGWIIPNFLDQSLMVYNSDGKPIGFIRSWGNSHTIFRSSPGRTPEFSIRFENEAGFDKEMAGAIPENVFLRNYVASMLKHGADHMSKFIKVLDKGLSCVEPGGEQDSNIRELLSGRPVAIVRVSLALDLKGLPVVNQSLGSLAHDISIKMPSRDCANFTNIKFPIRLGSPKERNEYNDGLIGYYREAEGKRNYDYNTFYSYQADSSNDHIVNPADSIVELTADKATLPITLLVLMDPRGKLSLTSGILPKKSIEIPLSHYEEFYQSMEVSFLATPVLHYHREWDLNMISAADDSEKQKLIDKFKAEPNKNKYTVLIVYATKDNTKVWTITMFDDEGRFFSKELIDDINNELANELNKNKPGKDRIFKLATLYLGITPGINIPISGEGDFDWIWIGKNKNVWEKKKVLFRNVNDLSESPLMISEGWLSLVKREDGKDK